MKYPSYKDSGVEWLGDVPEHWELWKMAHAFETIGSGTTPSSTDNSYYNGSYPWVTTGELRENIITTTKKMLTKKALLHNSSLTLFPKDSILIAMYGATIGRLGKLGIDATTNQACCVMTNSKVIINNYVYYWLMGNKNEIINLAYGGGQPNISQDTISNLKISAPDIQEQQTIANYLDKATDKIDTLISKQTKLIELLKEKRQAVISTAVTRGLDSTVAMKDSGVEWLGEIPKHWEVKKLKFIAYAKPSNVDKKSKEDEKDVLLCNYTDVYYNDFITNKLDFMKATATDEQIKKFTLEIDDVIITKDSEGAEDIAIAACVQEIQDNLVCGYHLTHIKPTHCNGKYLFRAFNSNGIHDQFKVAANGITRYGIGVYGIDNAWFPVPPMIEQEEIAKHIDDKTSKIDTLTAKATKAIELLKEKRTSLISAAVTGKIDVREIA